MVSDVIRQKVNETLKSDISNNEQRIIEKMRKAGASDDDIEAARVLAGWKPESEVGESEVTYGRSNHEHPFLDPDKVQIEVLKRMVADLKAKGINNPTFMVHPDAGWLVEGLFELPDVDKT
jgi:hypothetical protein